ncbi:hypothetical protein T484DRAFT_1757219 [Baffinella frigidus]|nr:hypothetical protein T484DRAFT_1757219 [Cryptophyta sp. CCMP2293]
MSRALDGNDKEKEDQWEDEPFDPHGMRNDCLSMLEEQAALEREQAGIKEKREREKEKTKRRSRPKLYINQVKQLINSRKKDGIELEIFGERKETEDGNRGCSNSGLGSVARARFSVRVMYQGHVLELDPQAVDYVPEEAWRQSANKLWQAVLDADTAGVTSDDHGSEGSNEEDNLAVSRDMEAEGKRWDDVDKALQDEAAAAQTRRRDRFNANPVMAGILQAGTNVHNVNNAVTLNGVQGVHEALSEFEVATPCPHSANNSIDNGSRLFHCCGGKHNNCQESNLAAEWRKTICVGCLSTDLAKGPTRGWTCKHHTTSDTMSKEELHALVFRCAQGTPTAYTNGEDSFNPAPSTLRANVATGCGDFEPPHYALEPTYPQAKPELRIPVWYSALADPHQVSTDFSKRKVYTAYTLVICAVLPVNPKLMFEPLLAISTPQGIKWQGFDGNSKEWGLVKMGKNCKLCHNLHYSYPVPDLLDPEPWEEYRKGATAAFEKAQKILGDNKFNSQYKYPLDLETWCSRYKDPKGAHNRYKKRPSPDSSECEGDSLHPGTEKEQEDGWTQGDQDIHRGVQKPGTMWRPPSPSGVVTTVGLVVPDNQRLIAGNTGSAQNSESDESESAWASVTSEKDEDNSPGSGSEESSSSEEDPSSDEDAPLKKTSTALVVYKGGGSAM